MGNLETTPHDSPLVFGETDDIEQLIAGQKFRDRIEGLFPVLDEYSKKALFENILKENLSYQVQENHIMFEPIAVGVGVGIGTIYRVTYDVTGIGSPEYHLALFKAADSGTRSLIHGGTGAAPGTELKDLEHRFVSQE